MSVARYIGGRSQTDNMSAFVFIPAVTLSLLNHEELTLLISWTLKI